MYNLFKCSNNYSKTSGSLFQHCKDESILDNYEIIFTTDSFKFKSKLTGKNPADGNTKDVKILHY